MLHFKFDPELAQDSLRQADNSVVVSYRDEEKKNLAINYALFDKLYRNKSCLFIVPDAGHPKNHIDFLTKHGLEHLALFIEGTHNLYPADLQLLQENDFQDQAMDIDQIKNLESWLKNENAIAFANFDKLHKKLFGNLSRLNLIESYKRAQEETGGIEANLKTDPKSLALNKEEFWNLRSIIVDATKQFTPSYKKESLTLSFPVQLINTLNSSADIDGLVTDLIDFQKELNLVLKQMRQYLIKKRDELFAGCFNKVSNCIQELSLLKETYLTDQRSDDSVLKNLTDRYNSIIEVLKTDEFLKDSIHTYKLDNPTDLLPELELLVGALRNLNHIDTTNIDRYLSRLNKHNLKDKHFENLQSKVAHVIKKIQNKNILSSSYDSDAFTLHLQFQSLENIYQELETINHYLVDNRGFAEWKLYKKKQGETIEALLGELEKYPVQNWIVIFEAWYILQILSRDESFQKSFNGDALSFVSRLNNILLNKKIDYILKLHTQNREKAKQALLHSNMDLYSDLFKKGSAEHTSWKDILVTQSSFITSYFPIIIIRDSLAKELGFIKERVFDTILCDEMLSLKFLDLYHLRGISKYFQLYDPASIDAIAARKDIVGNLDPQKTTSCNLDLPMPFALENLQEFSTIERLNFCKKISKNIINFNSKLRLFQAKNLSVISFWSGFKNELFLEQFRQYGIKEIVVDDKENRIIEALLEPSNINVLLYSDGLLNSEKREFYAWQKHLVDCLQSAGVHCFDNWTDDLIQNGTGVILNVLEDIKLLLLKKENTTTRRRKEVIQKPS